MKCPKCGAENSDHAVYCGRCAGTIKESELQTGSSDTSRELESLSQMRPLIQSGFSRIIVRISGILGALSGVVFTFVGLYGLAGGTSVEFRINDRLVNAQEGGQIFLIIGIAILLVGVTLIYLGFKKKVLQGD